MITRQALEEREDRTLAPYAAKSGKHRGRRHPEEEHPYRTAFQRDRDRVIHSAAFFNWANRLMLSLGEPAEAAGT